MDLADLKEIALNYDRTKAERLAADKAAQVLKTQEDDLFFQLALYCKDNGGAGVDMGDVLVEYEAKLQPVANDWNLIHKYIKEYDAIDLVHKRLTESAVKLRWDDNIDIPGVGEKIVDKIKVSIKT